MFEQRLLDIVSSLEFLLLLVDGFLRVLHQTEELLLLHGKLQLHQLDRRDRLDLLQTHGENPVILGSRNIVKFMY